MKKPTKVEEETGIKTWAGQKNAQSFVLFTALCYREIKVKTGLIL